MKLLTLYNKNVSISYKHSVCSFAALFAAVSLIFVCTVPYYLVCYVNSDLWWQPHMVWEQPRVQFQYRYILMGEHRAVGGVDGPGLNGRPLVVISSFDRLNAATEKWQTSATVKVLHYFFFFHYIIWPREYFRVPYSRRTNRIILENSREFSAFFLKLFTGLLNLF